jgi:hypothetical protein
VLLSHWQVLQHAKSTRNFSPHRQEHKDNTFKVVMLVMIHRPTLLEASLQEP